MRYFRKTFIILLVFSFLHSFILPLYAYTQMPEFLCELGMKYYRQGDYASAQHEFQKALLISPDYAPALKYLQMLKQVGQAEEEAVSVPQTWQRPSAAPEPISSQEALELIDIQKEVISERQPVVSPPKAALPEYETLMPQERVVPAPKKVYPPRVLYLDEAFSKVLQPILIEQGRGIVIVGQNIHRFLVTYPDVLTVERRTLDEILITGRDIGYTYVYIWDDRGRWNIEFLSTLPRPEGPTLEEEMLRDEERAHAFKLRYYLDWNTFEVGRRWPNLKRQGYSWLHSLTLNGSTPYGEVDASANIRTLRENTDLTFLTLGLEDGSLMSLKDFSLRGMDFSPGFSNLVFPGSEYLRGVRLASPAFEKKMYYTVFWGRYGGGRYGSFSPGLSDIQRTYYSGLDLNYYPNNDINYGFSLIRGWGNDRPGHLNEYGYDGNVNWHLGGWNMGYELGYDTDNYAQIFSGAKTVNPVYFSYEFRDIDRDFLSMTGDSWRQGELGGLFRLDYKPMPGFEARNYLDIYRDRKSPALDNEKRWNQNYNFDASYDINPAASLRFYYTLENELGRASQTRYQSPGIGIYNSFNIIRKINTHVELSHQENKDYGNPPSDYVNEKLMYGLGFSLIQDLRYYINQEWSWLEERYYGRYSRPKVLETGLEYTNQIADSPFYEDIRFTYRNEENSDSPLSFLSGEESIEGYSELSYRPQSGPEIYGNMRVRNVWANNPNVAKRLEADFNAGMRYTWDTGIRWESVGSIEGYVFKDLNADGLRQRDEAPVEGIKIILGKKKSATTDLFGYYKFTNIKGKKAYVSIDADSLPSGFVLTVPQIQEASIVQAQTQRLDFGMISRSEISGIVFYDANQDSQYGPGDIGFSGVGLALEDGTKATTSGDGRYYFRNVPAGEHTINLNLESLPIDYLPQVALSKKIILFEGVTYIYNIPLKKAQQ